MAAKMDRGRLLTIGWAVAAAAMAIALPAQSQSPTDVQLRNTSWRVFIDPRTLAIRVQAAQSPVIEVSRGVGSYRAVGLTQTDSQVSWTWIGTPSSGEYHISSTLKGHDLILSIAASQPGELTLLDQPASAVGRGLILPLAEGHYVPVSERTWRDFLTGQKNDLDTTEDLSLPLWGLDRGAFTLHWLLTNPFNNELHFSPEGDGFGIKVSHGFTPLSPQTPMTMILHLGKSDAVAGAKRYRQYLIDSGTYETLTSKLANVPEARKLVGAAHIYLWGNGLIGPDDVRDWPGFIAALAGDSTLAANLRSKFDGDVWQSLEEAGPQPGAYQKRSLVRAFNAALQALARAQWQTDDVNTAKLVATYPELRRKVAADFGAFLSSDPAQWGEGLSPRTFRTLQSAELKRLWIGLGDGWEGGLWHPESVRMAVEAGYLIAPYDSYGTANKPGERPDWATAQLGRAAYDGCGIVQRDGSVKSGFQKTGHYTNTLCMTPILKSRVAGIATATGFNSWFLDVSASGLVLDDYRAGHEMTMAQNARANVHNHRWISQTLRMPLGSESGSTIANGAVLFAHGMKTPPIGWGDPDLHKNTASPYFFGAWYPDNEPAIFFRTVPIKEPYRALHFAPQNRLPLYQAVFHGSVITTHHWLYDNLKLKDATAARELAQLLYDVPPLYHLSANSLKARLQMIQKQDAFFRPLHQALAEKTMEGFAWLSSDRLIHATTFSDGSRLIANFDEVARQAEGHTLPPLSVTAMLSGRTASIYRTGTRNLPAR